MAQPVRPVRALSRIALLALLGFAGWMPAAHGAGVVQFLEPWLNAREGESRQITVVRSGDTTGEATVVLNVSLGGTARLGEDFTVDLPLGVIRIPAGQTFARVPLEILQDTRVEGTEYAVFTLANPAGATLGRENALLLQIEDDETPSATLRIQGESVRRVVAGQALSIEVSRSGLASESVSAVLLGVPGTAALGLDYSDLNVTLQFAAEATIAEATLSTLAPAAPTFPRTLSLLLATPSPDGRAGMAGLGPRVVIEEPTAERGGEFTLFTANAEVRRDGGVVSFTVDRNRGSTGAASVDYVTVDGSASRPAVAGRDYVITTGTLLFAEGETRKTFDVPLVQGGPELRENRRFQVALANPTGRAGIDPELRRVTVTILADEGARENECRGFCDCFIATAAWGSWMDPHVRSLRDFRDDVLMQTAPGRTFVRWYYRHSPPVAEFIARHEALRAATRAALAPVVFAVERPAAAATAWLLGLWLLNLGWRARRNRRS